MTALDSRSRARRQRGSTLIELVMAMGVATIIMSGVSYTVLQVFNMNTRNTIYMTAVRNAQSAGYWVALDGEKANSVIADNDSATSDVLQLTWLDVENLTDTHSSNFTLENRTLFRNVDGVKSKVAEQIDSANAVYDAATRRLVFTVTSTVTSRNMLGSETRTYRISPRPRGGGQ